MYVPVKPDRLIKNPVNRGPDNQGGSVLELRYYVNFNCQIVMKNFVI